MKVRFYCDVPVTNYSGPTCPLSLAAWTALPAHAPSSSYKRICFDVDFPPDVLVRHEATGHGVVSNVTVVEEPT